MDKVNNKDGARNGRQQQADSVKQPQAGAADTVPVVQQGGAETVVQFRDWASI